MWNTFSGGFKTKQYTLNVPLEITFLKIHHVLTCSLIMARHCLRSDILYSTTGFVNIVVQSPSHVQLFATPWTAAFQASLSLTISWSLQVHVHWIGNASQPSHPLTPSFLPSILPHHWGLFQWASCLQVTEILELQHPSFQWEFRVDFP